MTVKELIEQLKEYNPEEYVYVTKPIPGYSDIYQLYHTMHTMRDEKTGKVVIE